MASTSRDPRRASNRCQIGDLRFDDYASLKAKVNQAGQRSPRQNPPQMALLRHKRGIFTAAGLC
jgi:hypothetical protein